MTRQSKVSSILRLLALILIAAALVIMLVCNAHGIDYAFNNTSTLLLGMLVALLATGLAGFAHTVGALRKLPNWTSFVASLGGILVSVLTVFFAVSRRVLLFSGLFSWNSMNTVGWEVFRFTVAMCACLFVAAVLLVVACFITNKVVVKPAA